MLPVDLISNQVDAGDAPKIVPPSPTASDPSRLSAVDEGAEVEVDSIPEAGAEAAYGKDDIDVDADIEDSDNNEDTWRTAGDMNASSSSKTEGSVDVVCVSASPPQDKKDPDQAEQCKEEEARDLGLHDIMNQRNSLPGQLQGTSNEIKEASPQPPVTGAVLIDGVWYTPYVPQPAKVPSKPSMSGPTEVVVPPKHGGCFICFSM